MNASRSVASTVLFDLDGTLVDSAPAILTALRVVLDRHGIDPVVPLDHRLIGAPLVPTLVRLTGAESEADVTPLVDAFRNAYDGEGLAATLAYDGLRDVLRALARDGRRMFVVTNKRERPTRRILELLGVASFFAGVYALDGPELARDKRELVARVITAHDVNTDDCVMIGDTVEDAVAAFANDVLFIAAMYGYGAPTVGAPAPALAILGSLRELPSRLREIAPDLQADPAS